MRGDAQASYNRAMRIALGTAGTLLMVALAAVASGHLLRDSHARALADEAARGAAMSAMLFTRETAATRTLMQHVCTRDVVLERLLSDGARPQRATEALQDLRALLGGELWMVLERDGLTRRVGLSADFTTTSPSLEALREASATPRMFVGSSPLVIASCARTLVDGRLWIVRVEPLAALLARVAPPPPLRVISEAEAARGSDDEHANARSLRI